MTRVLILGGTTEARLLAAALVSRGTSPTLELGGGSEAVGYDISGRSSTGSAASSPAPELGGASRAAGYDNSAPSSTERRYEVTSSLAGRTSKPLEIAGAVRIGGFGGTDGLARHLTSEQIDVLVDATHPFAHTMTHHAIAAATRTGVPVLVLRRPGWVEGPGDDWRRVRDLDEAAALVPHLGDRVFLTTGRQSVAVFAGLDALWFLARSVEMPEPPMPRNLDVVLDRGPFALDGELRLLREHRINVLVTKDSGGSAPKLAAARELGIPVVMVDRPPIPDATTVTTVEQAVEWLETALPKVAER